MITFKDIVKDYQKMAPEERDALIKQINKLGKQDAGERLKGRLLNLQNEYKELTKEINILSNKRRKNRISYNSTKTYMRTRQEKLDDKSIFESLDKEVEHEIDPFEDLDNAMKKHLK